MLNTQNLITVGKITGAFGVRGWVRLISYTDPIENLFNLQPLLFTPNPINKHHKSSPDLQIVHITAYERHKHDWVVKFAECEDRDQAFLWRGASLQVTREQLPALPDNQYYWVDLEGLQVVNLEHQELGHITHLFTTGANDIIAVKQGTKERYIPFLRPDVVKDINLATGIMIVDWDADF